MRKVKRGRWVTISFIPRCRKSDPDRFIGDSLMKIFVQRFQVTNENFPKASKENL
jgi:hypothetical protein